MSEEVAPLSQLMCEVVALAERLGVRCVNLLPGCWEIQVDEHWWIALNGHRQSISCTKGADVPPFHCYVEYNGWPAGFFDAFGGVIAAGACANEGTLIGALKERK